MIRVDVVVEKGRVIITVGGASPPKAATGTKSDTGAAGSENILERKTKPGAGGGPRNEDTGTGGGGPAGGTIVIGPIVVDAGALGCDSGNGDNGGGPPNEDTGTGGGPRNEDTGTGGGGAGGGVTVIGPIVIGAPGNGGAAPTSSKAVAVPPPGK